MVNQSFHVQGMTCASCSSRVEKVLNKMEHVEAKVNLATEVASVEYDEEKVQADDIIQKIQKIGYEVEEAKLELQLIGMTCAACASRIEKVLQKKSGVIKASVNLAAETASLTYYPDLISEKDIIDSIQKIGYDAAVRKGQGRNDAKQDELRKMRIKLI